MNGAAVAIGDKPGAVAGRKVASTVSPQPVQQQSNQDAISAQKGKNMRSFRLFFNFLIFIFSVWIAKKFTEFVGKPIGI